MIAFFCKPCEGVLFQRAGGSCKNSPGAYGAYIAGQAIFGQTENFHARSMVMSLINLVITLVVVGVGLWAINAYIPMDRKIKSILNVVVVIIVILWLLRGFGLLGTMNI